MRGRGPAVLAVGGLLAVVALLFAVFSGGSDAYEVTANFENASQLVGGEIVTIAGSEAGLVDEIKLAADGSALVSFHVDDAFAPLPRGTIATVRSFSLAGVANRQVELTLPPPSTTTGEIADGGLMDQTETVSDVDLDAVFNTLDDRTVADLKNVIGGLETSYSGVGKQANRGYRYLNPLLSTSRQLVGELGRDDAALEGAVVDTARLSGALAERAPDISQLVHNANVSLNAIGNEHTALAEAVRRLPDFMRNFNTTAVNLRATLDDLDPLVDASRPAARRLRPFFHEFRGAAAGLVPTVRDLDTIVRRPGESNDLIELLRLQPALAEIAVGPVDRNGASRLGAFPASVNALTDSLPVLSFFRPYTPELLGWMDDFGHSGITDANGGLGRISSNINTDSAGVPGFPQIFSPPDTATQQIGALSTANTMRCPGTNERNPGDGSTPFTDGGAVDCDPSQVPVGP